MKPRFLMIGVAALAMSTVTSGCATVDLQEMAGPSVVKSAPKEVNVVTRAVEKLKAAFASRGFSHKDSRKNMVAAADMLLNGLSSQSVSQDNPSYADQPRPRSVVIEDLQVTQGHVVQTTRAAEIYLEMAPESRDLRDELRSLESALLASEQASSTFSTLLGEGDATAAEFADHVDALREVTDAFGIRVRMGGAASSTANAAS